MRPSFATWLPLLLPLALHACADARPEPAPPVDDVLEIPPLLATEAVRIGRIDPQTDSAALVDVGVVRIGPDGGIWVLDRGRTEVLVFEPDGRARRIVGRRGAGPGEFSGLFSMGFVGDTVWVEDWMKRNVSLFALDGTFLRSFQPELVIDAERFRGPDLPLALLEGGHAVYEGRSPHTTLAADAAGPVLVVQLGRERRDTIATRQLWRHRLPVPGLGTLSARTMRDDPLLAIDGAGRTVAVIERAPAEPPSGRTTIRITIRNARGAVLSTEQIGPLAVQPVAAQDRAVLIDSAVAALERTMSQIAEVRERVSDARAVITRVLTFPAALPPVDEAIAARDGRIWLRVRNGHGIQHWIVLDPATDTRTIIALPADFRLHDADARHAWGVVRDSLDVHYVVGMDIDPS